MVNMNSEAHLWHDPRPPLGGRTLTVSELNQRARECLEREIGLVTVTGELSNVTRAASGHWYFTVKDAHAQVRAAMFRGKAQWLDFVPKNGDTVRLRARVSLYEPRGDYQLTVESMAKGGAGDVMAAFVRLKQKLESEGLFAAERKRPLPTFPRAVGVISSTQGAALHDVLTTLTRRAPGIAVVIYPAKVQGDAAAGEIMLAIDQANARSEVDVLILARGGGAAEDLAAFNDEALARAISRSIIPIISGVGHETDFTIADFVADARAATPTAAAVAAVPDQLALRTHLGQLAARVSRQVSLRIERYAQQLDMRSARLLPPAERLARLRERLASHGRRIQTRLTARLRTDRTALEHLGQRILRATPPVAVLHGTRSELAHRLSLALQRRLIASQTALSALRGALEHLSPPRVMARGFAVVRDDRGQVVRESGLLAQGQAIQIQLAKGGVTAQVKERLP